MLEFTKNDCSILQRYQRSVSWNEVPDDDKEKIKSIRARLKSLATKAQENYSGDIEVKAFASHPTPNGRSPKELWCCIYPKKVENKSFGLQVALIAMANGFEICFCLGAGSAQIGNQEKAKAAQRTFDVLQAKLRLSLIHI